MGNLCRDPEIKYTAKGAAVCNFTLAHNEKWSVDGEEQSKTTFVECTAFRKTADLVAQWFKKGKPMLVEGKLDQQSWTGKDGAKKSKLVVIVDKFHFLPRNSDTVPATAPAREKSFDEKAAEIAGASEPADAMPEDDVPF